MIIIELLKFYNNSPSIDKFLDKKFIYENEEFTITTITKTWGKPPCFLGWCIGKNQYGEEDIFLISSTINTKSRQEMTQWELSINKQ